MLAHNQGYNPWSAQEDETLRKMVEAGYTFREVGEALGRNRNACIGRAHRLKVSGKPQEPSNSPRAVRDRARRAGMVVESRRRPAELERVFVPPAPKTQDNAPQPLYAQPEASTTAFGAPRRLLELEAHHCKWPTSGEGAATLFCCADRESLLTPYCTEHRLVAWRQTPRQNLSKLAKAYR